MAQSKQVVRGASHNALRLTQPDALVFIQCSDGHEIMIARKHIGPIRGWYASVRAGVLYYRATLPFHQVGRVVHGYLKLSTMSHDTGIIGGRLELEPFE